MRKRDHQSSRHDPTGEVDLENPAAVEKVIKSILDRVYGDAYDSALLKQGFAVLVEAYRGGYPGLLRCDTLYHDLRHALETGLTMTRLLDANAKLVPAGSANDIDGSHALLGTLLALFHDIGMLRRETEAETWGAMFTPIHEERGVDFMRRQLSESTLAALAEKAELIMPTKLVFKIPHAWSPLDRKLASMVASADLLSQLSDCCYLEKCWHFLFLEFSAFGLAGKPDSVYPKREILMAKTASFYSKVALPRLEDEFSGVYRLMDAYYSGNNPYTKAINGNLAYLAEILSTQDFSRMKRRPRTFVGAA